MSTFIQLLAIASLTLPAAALAGSDTDLLSDDNDLAFNDDLDFETELTRGKTSTTSSKKKVDEATPALPTFEEPTEEFDLLDESEDAEPDELLATFDGLDDDPIEEFDRVQQPQREVRAPIAGPITLEVAGKEPLSNNYPMHVVAIDKDAVIVELPVLVAKSRVGFETSFTIQADVYSGDTKVAQVQQTVEKASLAEFGPSFVFLKVLAPVIERTGEIKMVVSKRSDASTSEMFTKTTPYALR